MNFEAIIRMILDSKSDTRVARAFKAEAAKYEADLNLAVSA